MKIKFLTLLLVGFTYQVTAQNTPVRFRISGDIAGIGNDSVVLKFENAGKADTLLTIAKNNHFEITGQAVTLLPAYLYFGGMKGRKTSQLFLENGSVQLTGSLDKVDDIVMSGTPQNVDFSESRKGEMVFYNQIPALNELLKNEPDAEKSRKLNEKIQSLRDSVVAFRLRFVEAHPSSMASIMNLWVLQDHIEVPLLERLFTSLDPSVQAAGFGPKIKSKIVARKRTAPGNSAPAFAVKDMNGLPVSLASLKGKYVLLDFWASWCVPCRAENPYLKTAYQKFKDRNFIIVSISADADREKWVEAIKKDGLPWMHVLDGPWPEDGIASLYGVQPIPDNFLIDPNGKIVARALRGEELEPRLIKEMEKGIVKAN